MSFFNKVFASVGIGSATVDTKLEKDSYMPGETVKGLIEINGGKIDQQIDEIYLSLNTTYLREADDRKYPVTITIERFRISSPFMIGKNERREIPFTFRLPDDTPISVGNSRVWVTTGLDIKGGVDPSDKDFLRVIPNSLMAAVFNAVDQLGFSIREAECEEAPRRLRGRLPFIQEFEFIPVTGPFRGRLDELEIVFFPTANGGFELLLQVDRKARGLSGLFSEAMGSDETFVRVNVTNSDIPYLTQKLQTIIQRFS
ncbi:sporulation protein [Bacillus rubiinfantis]|uniref:sporulation protein n=1 Tax=Bacillus rubiinfantis TaxID=1499680 RepID=UPI0005A77381|nr:sporulation protein [Bacillus rubiinfantis]